MNWKKYKALPQEEKRDEIYYIIGLDIGNNSSGIAYYNLTDKEPELIDLSGGYGRPTIPTVMQYIVETKEWVFGEYAILNRSVGREITFTDLVDRLGHSEYVDIDSKPMSVVNLLSLYIKELLSNITNINPKAEIAGIVASVPSYFSANARKELTRAFKNAGYEKELIGLVSDRECIYAYHYRKGIQPGQKSLLIDYGSRGVRGGVYVAKPDGATLRSISSLFDDSIGALAVDEKVLKLFEDFYLKNNPMQSRQSLEKSIKEQLAAFVYQHKDILFQKAIRNKPAKLYFNFAFPPFQQAVTMEDSDNLIDDIRKNFNIFIRNVLEKNMAEKVSVIDIDVVLCVGGGFEMLWAKEAIGSLFPQNKLQLYKNAKAVTVLGATVVAAKTLEVLEGNSPIIEDRHQLPVDIGIQLNDDQFIPLAECNSFWWQQHPTKLFIINSPVEDEIPFTILSRTPDGDSKTLADEPLINLPKRPKGATRLSVQLKFLSDSEAMAKVADCGFGELFPKMDYEQEIMVRL